MEAVGGPGLCSPWAFTQAAACRGAAGAWGQGARTPAARKAVPLWQHNQSRGQGGGCARWAWLPGLSLSPPPSSPCGSSCHSSSPSELLRLELEPEPGLGLRPGLEPEPEPGPAKQAKCKGLPGKIPFREFSRQWSGEGFVAAPGP